MMRRNINSYSSSYIPGIDVLRAIAVLAVILFHAGLDVMKSGFSGVDVFFVISGYVVSGSLARDASKNFMRFTLNFYKRRVVRIFPALIVCLIVTSVVATLFIPSSWLSRTSSETGLAAFFGYSNFALIWFNDSYFSPKVEFNPFVHTWSLGAEEQFYIIFPFIIYLWLNHREKKDFIGKMSNYMLPIVFIVSLVYSWHETAVAPESAFYLLPSRFWELAAGGLLFMLHRNNLFLPGTKRDSLIYFIPGVILVGLGFVVESNNSFPFPMAILPIVGSMVLISCAVGKHSSPPLWVATLESDVLVYIGKISYSLYLWHWPVFVLFRWTLGLDDSIHIIAGITLTFVLAILSYHVIEMPIRTTGYIKNKPNWVIVHGGVVIVVLAYFLANYVFDSQKYLSLSVTQNNQIWYPYSYPSKNTKTVLRDEKSLLGKNLYVIGDSHAGAYTTMFRLLEDEYGVKIHKFIKGGCSIASMIKPLNKGSACEKFMHKTISKIEKNATKNDIVFLASLRMNRLTSIKEVFNEKMLEKKQYNKRSVRQRKLALEEAKILMSKFEHISVQVIIDAPKPIFKISPYRCSDWFNADNPACVHGFTMSRTFLERYREPVMKSFSELAGNYSNLHVWDTFPVLCKLTVCSAFDDDKPLFFDSDHLSAHGNRVLYPSFLSLLKKIWHVEKSAVNT